MIIYKEETYMKLMLLIFLILLINLSCDSVNFEVPEDLKLTKAHQFDNVTYRYYESTQHEEKLKLTIKSNFTRKQFKSYKHIETSRIAQLYNDSRVPYLGAITKEISTDCKEEDLPEVFLKETEFTVIYKANNKLHYGICRKELISHKGILKLKYCPNSERLFKFEYSSVLDNFTFKEFIKGFKCKD